MTLRKTTDVNYLNSKIESDSLEKDGVELVGSGNVSAPTDATLTPQIVTTGSNLTYIVGQFLVTGTIAADGLIATLPNTRAAARDGIYSASFFDSTGVTTVPISIAISGSELKAIDAITFGGAGDALSLDGIVYLSE